MNEHALEAQGVAALGVRRKTLKTFEVIMRKMIRRAWRTAGGELVVMLSKKDKSAHGRLAVEVGRTLVTLTKK